MKIKQIRPQNAEYISALVDGEAIYEHSAILLDSMNQEPNLEQKWMRYHLIRDLIRKGNVPDSYMNMNITQSVALALENEKIYSIEASSKSPQSN